LQEEKSKCAGLAWEIGFAAADLLSLLLRLVTGGEYSCAPAKEECNEYDLTSDPCF
jgi:hypothetical protein